MKLQNNNAIRSILAKVLVALVLTVTATVGSGVLAEQVGISTTSIASACSNGGGGGC